MTWKTILLILLAVAVVGGAAWFYFGRGGKQGFQNQSNPAPAMNTFTMYYADWCPHCQTVKPEFTTFASSGAIKVGSTTCNVTLVDAAKNPAAAKGKPVRGFPTFLLETTDGKIVEYQGERNTAGWTAFINTNLGGGGDSAAAAAK